MEITSILERLQGVKKSGSGWTARCPAHDDKNPSLAISEGADGKILLKCHAGCDTRNVCAALNIKPADLFPERDKTQWRIAATYDYKDAKGKLLFQVCRLDPKDFRQRKPDATALDGWTWNTRGVEKVLFRLPETLADIQSGRFIFVTEGERDVLAMVKHGFSATTNPGGAGKWQDSYGETLRGANVVIVADKDAAGRAHAQLVAGKLHGMAKSVRVLELPGEKVKDAADFFNAGGDAGQIGELVDKTPEWTPGSADINGLPAIENAANLLADDEIKLPPEIIEGVLHQGLKCIIGSGSKDRKTWILLDAALSIASGKPFWKWNTKQGRVLYVNFEIPTPFLKSRIRTLAQSRKITDTSGLDTWNLRGHAAPFHKLLPEMKARIRPGAYSAIFVDPIYKGLGGRDENSAGDIGELCNELERLAVATGAAIVFAAHYSKGNQAGKESIDRIGGSGVFGRDADSIITLTKHETEGAYTVELTLRNLPEQPAFVVQWDFPLMRETPELDPGDLKQAGGRKPEFNVNQLLEVLPAAGLENKEWLKAADEENGIGERTFYRLRKELETSGKIIKSKVTGKWTPVASKP